MSHLCANYWIIGTDLNNLSVFYAQLLVKNLQFEDGKMIPASKYFSSGESSSVELTDEEKKMAEEIRARRSLCFSN